VAAQAFSFFFDVGREVCARYGFAPMSAAEYGARVDLN
jgi:hypothetical protein